jgi:hypothetical protein
MSGQQSTAARLKASETQASAAAGSAATGGGTRRGGGATGGSGRGVSKDAAAGGPGAPGVRQVADGNGTLIEIRDEDVYYRTVIRYPRLQAMIPDW